MKLKLTAIFFVVFSATSSAHVVESSEKEMSNIEVITITMGMIEDKIPSFRNLWSKKVNVGGATTVYKQDNLFALDDVQYRDVKFKEKKLKMNGYYIQDAEHGLQSEGFLTNKIRLMAGESPISKQDNMPVMLCRLENHISDVYYEMSVTQYSAIREVFPSNYDISQLCTTLGATRGYWRSRLGDFYDNFGNKR